MAITFTKQPPTDKLVSAFNNSIMEFTSALTSPLYATITNDYNSTVIKVYPSPLGVFWVNLKPLYKSFFDLKDEVTIDLGTSPNITFVDDDLWKEVEFTVTVYNSTTNETSSTTLEIILQALQDKEPYLDKELQFISNNGTCFYGYPFSVDLYIPNAVTAQTLIASYGESNDSQTVAKGINRYFLNDGTVDGVINERLWFRTPEYLGSLGVILDITDIPLETANLQLTTYEGCDGIYLKWLSNNGWKYWLFNDRHKETINTRSLGQFENDFNVPEETNAPIIEVGKTSTRTWKLNATGIREQDKEHVYSILESPKVFLFTGTPNTTATLNDWLEVELVTSSIVTDNYGRTPSNIEFEIKTRRNTITML